MLLFGIALNDGPFLNGTGFIFFEVGTEFVHIIQMNFNFRIIKIHTMECPLKIIHQLKGKGKGRLWVLEHCCLEAYCTLTRMSSFIHLQRRFTHQAA